MGSYYRHTATQSVKIPYSFRCEQCHQDSGLLDAVITGSSSLNTHSKVLSDREQVKLTQAARAALIRELQDRLAGWFARYVDPAFDGSKEDVRGKGQLDSHHFIR